MRSKAPVTRCNDLRNLSRNAVARQVSWQIASCNTPLFCELCRFPLRDRFHQSRMHFNFAQRLVKPVSQFFAKLEILTNQILVIPRDNATRENLLAARRTRTFKRSPKFCSRNWRKHQQNKISSHYWFEEQPWYLG